MSYNFSVSNGLCQGGFRSPYLVCVYVDDFGNKLN